MFEGDFLTALVCINKWLQDWLKRKNKSKFWCSKAKHAEFVSNLPCRKKKHGTKQNIPSL